MSKGTSSGQSRNLIAYFGLAYAISWSIGIPLALSSRGIIPQILPPWAHYFIAYGPMVSAIVVTLVAEGPSGLGKLAKRIVMWRVPPVWWLAALSPLIIGLLVVLIMNFATGNITSLASLGEVNFLPPLGIAALALWTLTFGLGEEIGWRG